MRRRVRKIQDPDLAAALRLALEQGSLSVVDAIRVMRVLEGLSQEAFARRAGVTRNVIKLLEAGLTNPTLSTLEKVAGVLGLRVAFIGSQQTLQLFDAQAWSEDQRRRRDLMPIAAVAKAARAPSRERKEPVEPLALGYTPQSLA